MTVEDWNFYFDWINSYC